jgi:hypothetical protein
MSDHDVFPIATGEGPVYAGGFVIICKECGSPRCKFRKGCPYGMPGLGMHRCNQGIFEAEK